MRAPATVVPLVLAAGASTRLGSPKAAARLGATTALGRLLDTCAAVGLGAPVVVAGADPGAVRAAAEGREARHVVNPRWAEGRTTSIQTGLRALPAEANGALLWPVDACLVGAALVAALVAAWAADPAALACVPSRAGRRGHPLLLDRAALSRFEALGPDEPARAVTRALAAEDRLVHVASEDEAVLMNLDTPEQLARWRAWDAARRGTRA